MGMKKAAEVVCSIGLALVWTACSTHQPAVPTPNFVAWSQDTHTETDPKRVCVLPFTNKTGRKEMAGLVRKSFAGHLSIKRFADAELYEIDKKLPQNWGQLPARALGQTLDCQVLVYGLVSKASRTYLGIYSGISLDGSILVIDAQTGKSLLEEAYATRFRSGGLPLSLIGIVPSAVLNLRTMTDEQMVRAVDDLGRHLAAAVPDVPEAESRDDAAPAELPRPVGPSPAAKSAASPLVALPESRADSYRVQVAAFRSSSEARHAVQLLRDEGYQPKISESADSENSWHRVVVGPFPSVAEARQESTKIQQLFPFSPVVKSLAVP